TFAAQAVIAMENARLLGDLRQRTGDLQEALEQQTATAEVLQVINASPGDLAPVFEAILERAALLCDTSFGSFSTFDGEAFLNVVWRGMPPPLDAVYRDAPIYPQPGMAMYQIVHGEDAAQIADLKDEIYRSGHPLRRALVDLGGARTQLTVALRKDDSL